MTWYVVHDRGDWDDSYLEDGEEPPRIYTISRDPHVPGWETDSGQHRYGLTKADAEEIVSGLNLLEKLRAGSDVLIPTSVPMAESMHLVSEIYLEQQAKKRLLNGVPKEG